MILNIAVSFYLTAIFVTFAGFFSVISRVYKLNFTKGSTFVRYQRFTLDFIYNLP